jgi:hypothetical protein
MRPDYLIVCSRIGFILPVLSSALSRSTRSIGFTRKRYEGAYLISSDSALSRIRRVDLAGSSLVDRLQGAIGIGETEVTVDLQAADIGWASVLNFVVSCAMSSQSYSVWGYHYDSVDGLEVSLRESRDFNDLVVRLHATGEDAIAEALM